MRRIALAVAAAALIVVPVAGAQSAQAASTTTPNQTITTPAPAQGPKVLMFDCQGTTGYMGCGPGWFWRDGWRGFSCYPC
ncbi:hypothetical protein [Mycolicibacterium komossense]|jgi:hypothetical protein|uniref:Uncharacterized protein n=1 Tax=Mycolicibacterium komossense TaxID=1779 RepID=A0ABT3CDL0_9MYCO|nr:hypothetical protein [Mycolicibacterium komossense]MCV7227560.1 hypothetical protein [Mycolicibacterium komossense]